LFHLVLESHDGRALVPPAKMRMLVGVRGTGRNQSVLALARTNSDSSILAIISGGEFPT
jgi:hypothetical protein